MVVSAWRMCNSVMANHHAVTKQVWDRQRARLVELLCVGNVMLRVASGFSDLLDRLLTLRHADHGCIRLLAETRSQR